MNESFQQTVEVQVYESELKRREALQEQITAILIRIDSTPEVTSTYQKLEAVQSRLSGLKKTQSALMKTTGDLYRHLACLNEEAEAAVAEGAEVSVYSFRIMQSEAEYRLATRTHQRLTEMMIPEEEIQELLRTASHLAARAKATREEAVTRIEQTAKLMAQAAEFEGHISFDPVNTLSGALIAQAEQMEQQVDQYRRWATEKKEKYQQIQRELQSIKLLRG